MSPEKTWGEHELLVTDLSQIMTEVKKFNNDSKLRGLFGLNIVKTNEKDGSLTDYSNSPSEEVRAEEITGFMEIKIRNEATLNNIGLEMVLASTGERSGAKLRFDLKDGKKFVEYLKQLSSESISENEREKLKDLKDILVEQLKSEYDLDNAEDDRLLQLIGNLGSIIEEYKRLGIYTNDLEKYLEASHKKYLKELIEAEKLGILRERKYEGWEFGIGYHPTVGLIAEEKKWSEKVFSVLQRLAKNSSAKDLYEKVFKSASNINKLMIEQANRGPWRTPESEQERLYLLRVLRSTETRLSEY